MEKYILRALENAKKAFKKDEVPVGAVIVKDDKIIAEAYNMRNRKKNVLYHAEIIAINKSVVFYIKQKGSLFKRSLKIKCFYLQIRKGA